MITHFIPSILTTSLGAFGDRGTSPPPPPPPPTVFPWSAINEGGTDTAYEVSGASSGTAVEGETIGFTVISTVGPDDVPNLRSTPATTLNITREGARLFFVTAIMPESPLTVFFGGTGLPPGGGDPTPPPGNGDDEFDPEFEIE